MEKIAAITGSRADFSLLLPILNRAKSSSRIRLEIVASGSHFAESHDYSFHEIANHGYSAIATIPISPEDDKSASHALALGHALPLFEEAYRRIQASAVMVIGDRPEVLIASFAAVLANTPIIHIHGGELTLGAIDDAIRHSVSKMSSLHFVAHKTYKNRLIQMGESPESIVVSGAPGAENALLADHVREWKSFKDETGINPDRKLMLVTFHPATLDVRESTSEVFELIAALGEFEDWTILFTGTNNDLGSSNISLAIREFVERSGNAHYFPSLGPNRYLAVMKHASVVVGNSSSGLIEAPQVGTASVNIGSRQDGRLSPPSVYHARGTKVDILNAIELALRHNRATLDGAETFTIRGKLPSEIIVSTIEKEIGKLTSRKSFFDLTFDSRFDA
jgi:UDP-hydrolysing UDP-N-acetyl-D-glucosamine 2-epimerase